MTSFQTNQQGLAAFQALTDQPQVSLSEPCHDPDSAPASPAFCATLKSPQKRAVVPNNREDFGNLAAQVLLFSTVTAVHLHFIERIMKIFKKERKVKWFCVFLVFVFFFHKKLMKRHF